MSRDRQAAGTRVLFVSGVQVDPPISGGTLRSSALASALGRQGLDVRVYSITGRKRDYLALRPPSTETWPGGIREIVDRGPLTFALQYASYALALPPLWLTGYLRAGARSPRGLLLPRRLREALAWCDAVVADFPFPYPVFSAPSARDRLRVLSTHNIEHHMFGDRSRWLNRPVGAAVRRIELKAAEAADVVVSCCAGDAGFFEAHARVRRSLVVPNGIDPRRLRSLGEHRLPTRQQLGIPEDVGLFLFTASKWGPNREAFEFLLAFAREHGRALVEQRAHILVVGNVTPSHVRLPGFTATGPVPEAEPYFAAADAALNPLVSGAGTNLKMCQFLAVRLPILTTPFGARGFRIEDGETGFVFERDGLSRALADVRGLLEREPDRLRRMADEAYARNRDVIDMDECVRELVEVLKAGRGTPP